MNLIDVSITPKEILDGKAEVKMMSYGEEMVLGLQSLPDLSNMLWGYDRGQIIVVAGRTSMGKSAFLMQNAYDFAKQGYKCVYLSLEMSEEALWIRNFCREKKINLYQIKRGGFKDLQSQWNDYKKQKVNFGISDCLGRNVKDIDNIIQKKLINKPDVIFIDHINEIRGENGSDKQAIDDYLTTLKTIAVHHNITFVIAAQINRISQDDKKSTMPMLHHLKSTGKLEEVANIVILLYWPWYYNSKKDKNIYNLIIAKNRDGWTGLHECNFFPEHLLFVEKDKYKKDIDAIKEEEVVWET